MQIIFRGSKCGVMTFLKHIPVFTLQAENTKTGRAYIGEVVSQVWLKSIKK